MTIGELERDVLSLRCWVRRVVLPTSLVLLALLVLMSARGLETKALDHISALVGFFALYFVLVRGGHLVMIRSLHAELKRKYPDDYAERLSSLPSLRGRNAGFALARIKRDMIHAGVIPNPNAKRRDNDWGQN